MTGRTLISSCEIQCSPYQRIREFIAWNDLSPNGHRLKVTSFYNCTVLNGLQIHENGTIILESSACNDKCISLKLVCKLIYDIDAKLLKIENQGILNTRGHS